MHIFSVLAFLWTVHSHRRLVVQTYVLLLVESSINAIMPLITAQAVDAALRGDWWALAGRTVVSAGWAFVFWTRSRMGTRAFDGAVTEAVIRHVAESRAKGVDEGEVLNNIRLSGDILVVTKYKLPHLCASYAFASGALVYLTMHSNMLGAAAVLYLVAVGFGLAKMASIAEEISVKQHLAQDTLKDAVAKGVSEDILRQVLALEVRWTNADATMSALASWGMGLMIAVAIVTMALQGATAGMVVAALAYTRSLDAAADVSGIVVQLSAKAADVCKRLRPE